MYLSQIPKYIRDCLPVLRWASARTHWLIPDWLALAESSHLELVFYKIKDTLLQNKLHFENKLNNIFWNRLKNTIGKMHSDIH